MRATSVALVSLWGLMIEKFKTIFRGNDVDYAIGTFKNNRESDGKRDFTYTPKTKNTSPFKDSVWEDHLNGVHSLGIYTLCKDSDECYWGCIDIDDYNGFNHLDLIKKIEKYKMPLVVCKSKSGGAHAFVFFRERVKTLQLKTKLKEMAAVLGHARTEIFPKNAVLKGKKLGNFLNIPYFGGDKTDRYALDEDGKRCSLEQFYTLYEANVKNKIEDLSYEKPDDYFKEGPICLNTLAQEGVFEGGRNETLANVVVYLKKAYPDAILEKLIAANKKMCNPPLPEDELMTIHESFKENDYDYACSKEPLCSNCDRKNCSIRKFGKKSKIDYDLRIDSIEKYGSDPAIYVLNVHPIDGEEKQLELEEDDFLVQNKFRKACLAQLHNMPRTVKRPEFEEMIQTLISSMKVVKEPGTSNTEILIEHIKEWCTNEAAGDTPEDVVGGKPWLNKEKNTGRRHHFRLPDLMLYLKNQNFEVFNQIKVARTIRQLLAGVKTSIVVEDFKTKNKRKVKVWAIKEFEDDMSSFELPVPDMKEKENY